MLQIDNLQYKYPKSDTLYSYDLSCKASEVVGITGESGSGKSTLLDIIAGFLEPESGSILLNSEDILALPIAKKPVTILFQNNNLFEHLSVETNILLGIDPKGKMNNANREKIDTILRQMKLQGYAKKLPTELSGGEQQRVALARALLRNKPILLLDEPFSALDSDTRHEMLDLVANITKENQLHTIMVTHEKEDCDLIANRVYNMKNSILREVI